MHYLIKDTEFAEILKFLSQLKGIHKNNIEKIRLFIEAVYYICRSGCQWRLLPIYYGNWRAVHKRFNNWTRYGIWKNMFEFMKKDPDLEEIMFDATIVRSHACSAGYGDQKKEALGRSKGGFSTKIHAAVDALGNPLKFSLTAGQRHEITQAIFLQEVFFDTTIIADTAYDSDKFVNHLINKGCTVEIPPRRSRKKPRLYDKDIYKNRHLVECFFGKIKHFRRIFSRFDKTAKSYLALLHFVGALIWLR